MGLRLLVALGATVMSATLAHGALILALDQPVQSAAAGSIVEFTGTITNTGPETLGLIDVRFTPLVDPPPFETGIPLVLLFFFKPAPGQHYTGVVFAIQIDDESAAGDVLNTVVTIEDRAGQVSPSDGVQVRLTVVPEPGSLILAGCALLGGLGLQRRLFRSPT